jgi:hypothetical protein
MLKQCIVLSIVALAWSGSVEVAAAQHERAYEFQGTHVSVSIERFMGIEYTDFEGPGGDKITGRLFLNGSERVPTDVARFGLDVFIHRFSIGLGAGVTTEDLAIIAPRVGYLFGLTPQLGLWLRAGGFYAATGGPTDYFGISAEALFAWFPYEIFAIHFGPTLNVAFATEDTQPDYIAIGLPSIGMTAWF